MTSQFRSLVWDKSITIYHHTESKDVNGKTVTTWTRSQLSNCFYGLKKRQVVDGLALRSNNIHIVRIPASEITEAFILSKGDIIVNGHVTDTLAVNDSGSALRTKYAERCFVVNVWSDNRSLPATAHLVASED